MKNSSRIFFCLLVLLAIPATAQAYIDPGTGSYLFQILIATILGVSYSCRGYFSRLKAFLSKKKAHVDSSNESPDNSAIESNQS